ncbi:MAG: GCN5-related N-acetyltransferase [Frankiales bacterium]|nr:GCN5-related N-acetyltransferase [Frankiales bacterium]
MDVIELDPDDDAAFDGWFAVHVAVQQDRGAVGPGWQRQELQALARAGADGPVEVRTLAVVVDGAVVGIARLDLPRTDNVHLAQLGFLEVHPDRRRDGVASALLARVQELARERGRSELVAPVDELPHEHGRSPGRAFAAARGLVAAQVDVRRDLLLPLDPARLDALEAQCRPHARGYALREWGDTCPDDLLEDRALLGRRMSTDAPAGDVPRGEEAWDGERVRFQERLLREQGRTRLSVGAVHEATGRLVAFTDLCVAVDVPERAYQWDTLVLREHRGHRLGTRVKLANLRRVASAWPATRRISTWNAEENAPMIAVNEALGCEVVACTTSWCRSL